jgi:hypothetical protein
MIGLFGSSAGRALIGSSDANANTTANCRPNEASCEFNYAANISSSKAHMKMLKFWKLFDDHNRQTETEKHCFPADDKSDGGESGRFYKR